MQNWELKNKKKKKKKKKPTLIFKYFVLVGKGQTNIFFRPYVHSSHLELQGEMADNIEAMETLKDNPCEPPP